MSETDKKVVTLAYGCQMSERDAETLSEISVQEGYDRSEDLENADLVIVNTCCVRESAENKILGKIGELKKLKEKNPNLKIAITGCMVQQPGALEKLQKRAPHVDVWTGTHNIHEFSRLLQKTQTSGKAAEVWDGPKEVVESAPMAAKGKFKTFVNIMYGCDNLCTYCIVPYVRGRERSRRPEDILQEIKGLVATGCREVTLLGQNVNSYGQESPSFDFSDLLQAVDQIPGLLRVRFMTSHPKDMSDKLIHTIANGAHLCEHFHLPIQSGSDSILARMKRNYTREYYLSRIAKVLEVLPQASVTTDIIVGFPGETEENFEETIDIIQTIHYSQAFTFMYSKRSGTPAAEMDDQIALDVKKRRLQRLMSVQNERSLEWRQKMVGGAYEILVEGQSKTNPERVTGRTRGNELVVFPGNSGLVGQLVLVKITEASSFTLVGELV